MKRSFREEVAGDVDGDSLAGILFFSESNTILLPLLNNIHVQPPELLNSRHKHIKCLVLHG